MRHSLLIILILIIALFLRVFSIFSNPPGLTPDEAALGYNAFSILKSGKDEYGSTLPIIFKSFGDYKPGLYIYMTVPFVGILGLSELSTRLPSVLAGTFIVLFTYLIVKKLFDDEKLAIISAAIAAFNPWLIFFSRAAWEANVSLCFTLIGIYFFLGSFSKRAYIILSAIFFGLTLLTYQGAKLSTLIVILVLFIMYVRDLSQSFYNKNRKILLTAFIAGLIIATPAILSFFNGQTQRLNVYSIFNYPRPEKQLSEFLEQGGELIGDEIYYLFHSEKINFIRAIAGRYFNNFSSRFLFFEGDWVHAVSNPPNHGMLLISDVGFLPIGLYVILKRKFDKQSLFILLWAGLAPFSAALSRDDINAVRDLNLAIPLIIIIAFGVRTLFNSKYRYLPAIYIIGVIYLFDALFVHLPMHNSNHWRYGYKQVFDALQGISLNNKIIVEQSFNQPYIYYLFYKARNNNSLEVAKYQNEEHLVASQYAGDVGFIENIDNIEFKNIDLNALQFMKGTVFVGSGEAVPDWSNYRDKFNLIKEIKYLDGYNVAFKIWEVK